MLYQPPAERITTLLDKARHRWPQLATRIDVAQQILLTRQLDYRPLSPHGHASYHDAWFCGEFRRVDERIGCTCPLHQTLPDADAPLLMGRLYCEHLIAYQAYKRLLLLLLNDAITHGHFFLDGHHQLCCPSGKALPCLTIVPAESQDPTLGFTFASPDDLGRFALWLGRRPPSWPTVHSLSSVTEAS